MAIEVANGPFRGASICPTSPARRPGKRSSTRSAKPGTRSASWARWGTSPMTTTASAPSSAPGARRRRFVHLRADARPQPPRPHQPRHRDHVCAHRPAGRQVPRRHRHGQRRAGATAGRGAVAQRLEGQGYADLLSGVRQACAIAIKHGLTPVLHQHCGSYIEFEDEVERMLADTVNDGMQLCIDTGHTSTPGSIQSGSSPSTAAHGVPALQGHQSRSAPEGAQRRRRLLRCHLARHLLPRGSGHGRLRRARRQRSRTSTAPAPSSRTATSSRPRPRWKMRRRASTSCAASGSPADLLSQGAPCHRHARPAGRGGDHRIAHSASASRRRRSVPTTPCPWQGCAACCERRS